MYRLHDAENKIERFQYGLDQIFKATREHADSSEKRQRLRCGEICLDSILPLDLVSLALLRSPDLV